MPLSNPNDGLASKCQDMPTIRYPAGDENLMSISETDLTSEP